MLLKTRSVEIEIVTGASVYLGIKGQDGTDHEGYYKEWAELSLQQQELARQLDEAAELQAQGMIATLSLNTYSAPFEIEG